jgi:hypothetical protein
MNSVGQHEKGCAMTRKTINYARVEACEAFTEGPAAFSDFVRTILTVAAPLHVLQTTTTSKLPEPVDFAPLSETTH